MFIVFRIIQVDGIFLAAFWIGWDPKRRISRNDLANGSGIVGHHLFHNIGKQRFTNQNIKVI